MKTTIEIDETNFETEVMQSVEPVVVDFWAAWCGPCKMLAPVLDEIAREQAGRAKVAKVNLDRHPSIAARFGIRAVPTLLYFHKGELAGQTIGLISKQSIVSRLDQLCGPAGTQTQT